MRITFSQATATAVSEQWIQHVRDTAAAMGTSVDPELCLNIPALADDTHVNYSVAVTDQDIVVNINDEVFLRYFGVVFRITRALIPFIKPLTAVIEDFARGVDDLSDFIHARK